MNIDGIIDRAWEAQQRAAAAVQRQVGAAVLSLIAGVLLLLAVLFLAIASYNWFETFMADYWAALSVAGAFVVAALIVLAAANRKRHAPVRISSPPPSARLADEMEVAADRAIDQAVLKVQRNPCASLASAVAAGFVLGMFRQRGRPVPPPPRR